MYKKNLLKATSVFTAFALACTSMTGCGLWGNKKEATDTEKTQEETKEDETAEELVDTMTKAAYTGSKQESDSGKEETVYVMTDAKGDVNDVVVSNWLKNSDGSDTITDTTSLKDIVNVKGDESYTDNGDGTVTWNAEGSDIYYQGTPTNELPIGVKVTYTLDGKEMTPEEIAGKSGNVSIRFDYTNTLKETVKIDGEDTEVDVPFTMISGTMLDNTKFSNVKVSKGKVISDANNYVIVGVAMPGLKKSLKIDDEKLEENDIDPSEVEIPDYVEITANVENFELPMTVSMASANVVSDLGLDKIYNSDKVDTLNDDMDELSDASTQLVDGSGKLSDGTGKLKDGTKELTDGVSDLKDGTGKLRDGAGELANGSGQLSDGASTLSNGIVTYTDGVAQLASGTTTLDDGVGKLSSGSKTLTAGIKSAKDGAKKLSDGADQLNDGIGTLSNGISTNLSAATLAKNTFGTAYGDIIKAVEAMQSGTTVAKNSSGADQDAEMAALIAEVSQKLTELSSQIPTDSKDESEEKDSKKKAEAEEEPEVEENNEEQVPENAEDPANGSEEANDSSSESGSDQNADNSGEQSSDQNTDNSGEQSSDQNTDETPVENTDESSSDNADSSSDSSEESTEQADSSSEESTDAAADISAEDGSNEEAVTDAPAEGDAATLGSSAESVSGVDEYAQDAGWQAIYGLTNYDKTYWDGVYAKASKVLTMQTDIQNALSKDQDATNAVYYKIVADCFNDGKCESDKAKYVFYNYADAEDRQDPIVANASLAAKYYGRALQYATKAIYSTNHVSAQMAGEAYSAATQIYMTYLTLGSAEKIFDTIYNGTGQGGLKDIAQGAGQIAKGADDLETGLGKLYKGGKQLNSGIGTLADGTSKLKDGANLLDSNSGALKDGASKLADGAHELSEGATKLSDGTVELDDGAGKLYDGTNELSDGVTELDDGARKLADGMIEFDEDGIQKLTSTVDDDLLSVTDRLKAVDEASQSFKTFSGANDDEPSSVQFIIRTEGISTDED